MLWVDPCGDPAAVFDPSDCAAVIACLTRRAALRPWWGRRGGRWGRCWWWTTVRRMARGSWRGRRERWWCGIRGISGKGGTADGAGGGFTAGVAWAATLDGDGQHAPADLPGLFRCAQETGAALVIGNRMAEAGKMSWLRRRVNRWMSAQLSRHAGRTLPDTQSGFRLIHLRTWAAMRLEAERFEVESETLMAFLAAGRRVEFVPVQVLASGRGSYIRPVADTIRWVRWRAGLRRPSSEQFDRGGVDVIHVNREVGAGRVEYGERYCGNKHSHPAGACYEIHFGETLIHRRESDFSCS